MIGRHRINALPLHRFVHPTPAANSVINAQYHNFMGGMFGADFQVRAYIFANNVRYKQYVRGYYNYNGVNQPHQLNGGQLNAINYLEDGVGGNVYGVLGQNIQGLSMYQAGNINGQQCWIFNGQDTPSDNLQCPSGTLVVINLSFIGMICDDNLPNFVYTARNWHVRGTYMKP